MRKKRDKNGTSPTGHYPITLRLKKDDADAARLDRFASIYGSRSAALRAGLEALERAHDVVEVSDGK